MYAFFGKARWGRIRNKIIFQRQNWNSTYVDNGKGEGKIDHG